jgi:uncharacterized membrane protein YphA (DoxX/SURF4 family)
VSVLPTARLLQVTHYSPFATPRAKRRFTLNGNKITIGAATVAMLVLLRLALGCHFLYEGVWKICPANKFNAEPFLSEAKGPAAPYFYAMLPDLDGRQRLKAEKSAGKDDAEHWTLALANENEKPRETVSRDAKGEIISGKKGRQLYQAEADRIDAWAAYRDEFVKKYGLGEEQAARVQTIYSQYEDSIQNYFTLNASKLQAYLGSLERFEQQRDNGHNGAAHQQKRLWDRQRELRREVAGWFAEIDSLATDYADALWNVLTEKQKALGPLPLHPAPWWAPWQWSRMEQINFAVTYGLTAIGLCLMLGFFTRLAALGGATFMLFVVLTQPAWPGLYPHDPPVLGHALLINKDVIEMLTLAMIATTRVGRWGGLDGLVHCVLLRRSPR